MLRTLRIFNLKAMYRYSLDKSSKKFTCPNCQKKTFVKYFDNEECDNLDSTIGRCDRESSCKYHKSPSKENYTISAVETIKKNRSFINKTEIINHREHFKYNNFIQFLKKHFAPERIRESILKYSIGTSSHWNGATVFWQIDNQRQVCTGKVMLFDINDGKRIKVPYPHINWMHKILKLQDYELQQCLFGLHLINEYKGQIIAIVESEKTAIMMSMFAPEYLWLATGSKTNFKNELLEPIKNYKILAFPDKSEFNDWSKKTVDLRKIGYQINCSRIIEDKNVENGYDLADYYLDKKINTEIKQTDAEIAVKKLAEKNPEILNLIKAFDLVDKYFNDVINIH
jgi:hypothetical protein